MTTEREKLEKKLDVVFMFVVIALGVAAIGTRYVWGPPNPATVEVCRLELADPSDAHDTLRVMRENPTCQRLVNDQIDRDRDELRRRNVPDTLKAIP